MKSRSRKRPWKRSFRLKEVSKENDAEDVLSLSSVASSRLSSSWMMTPYEVNFHLQSLFACCCNKVRRRLVAGQGFHYIKLCVASFLAKCTSLWHALLFVFCHPAAINLAATKGHKNPTTNIGVQNYTTFWNRKKDEKKSGLFLLVLCLLIYFLWKLGHFFRDQK